MHQGSPRNLVIGLLRVQALLTIIAAMPAFFLVSTRAGLGVLVGGAIGVLLSLVFALRTFAVPQSAPAQQMIAAIYRAAALKLLVAVILFALIARYAAHLFAPVMGGYLITLIANWIVGMRVAHERLDDEG